MSGFAPSGQTATNLDPRKRVNYQQGLVLGKDEFETDQFHHRSRDHHATRALHGYGTVSGLSLTIDLAETEVRVSPGLAVDPAGHLVCVPIEYCADLNAWLNREFEEGEPASIPASVQLWVVLCWTECETDEVPIPADSCLSAEDARAASRIMDGFELQFLTEAPAVVGEIAPGSTDDMSVLVEEIRALVEPDGETDASAIAALLRQWAVERRPELGDGNACLDGPEETCVLLGVIEFDVDGDPSGVLTATNPTVDDSARPVLASTRLLQEVLFSVADSHDHEHDHALGDLSDVQVGRNAAGNVLTFNGTVWRPAPPAGGGGSESHGDLDDLGADDHQQYLLTDGSRALGGDWSAGNNRINGLPQSNGVGQPIVHGQSAGGDLAGGYPDPLVNGFQGQPLNAREPQPRDGLMFVDDQWVAVLPTILPFATISQSEVGFTIWFNIDAPTNRVEVERDGLQEAFVIQREQNNAALPPTAPTNTIRAARNVFQVELIQRTFRPTRFRFDLDQVRLTNGATVLEWAREQRIWFLGQSRQRGSEFVTIYVADSLRNSQF